VVIVCKKTFLNHHICRPQLPNADENIFESPYKCRPQLPNADDIPGIDIIIAMLIIMTEIR